MKGGKLIGEIRLAKKGELPLLIQRKRYDEITELPFEDMGTKIWRHMKIEKSKKEKLRRC